MSTAATPAFPKVRVVRKTGETVFAVDLAPRDSRQAPLPLPNRLLSHFLDHFSKSARVQIELVSTEWPGSWQLDHVLCEDMGQLLGRGLAAIHDSRAPHEGLTGRGHSRVCMDDACAEVVLSFESRPRAQWDVPDNLGAGIDGFVDAWYDNEGSMVGWSMGTNLRQFVDGFALGAGATVLVSVQSAVNLHHLYEAVFRALGETVAAALGLAACVPCLPGDTSGLAGAPHYSIETVDRVGS